MNTMMVKHVGFPDLITIDAADFDPAIHTVIEAVDQGDPKAPAKGKPKAPAKG